MPRRLFVLGGESDLMNLAATDGVEAMGFRGCIAVQLADLPDGTKVVLRLRPKAEAGGQAEP